MTLTTSESVIAEVVFIFSSKRLYNLSRYDVRIRLYPILSLQGLRLAHKQKDQGDRKAAMVSCK